VLDDNEWIGAHQCRGDQLFGSWLRRSQDEKTFQVMATGHNEPLDTERWLAAYFPK